MKDPWFIAALLLGPILVGLPLLVFSCLFLGLFVRGNRTPVSRGFAMALVAALLAAAGAGLGIEAVVWLAQLAHHPVLGRAVVAMWLAPGLLALWACAYDADSSLGYASLLAMPLVLALPGSLGTVAAGHPFPAAALAVAVVAFWVWNQYPSRRLWRYRGSLEQCWCCGFRERAIRELRALGTPGSAVLRDRLARVPDWERRQMLMHM